MQEQVPYKTTADQGWSKMKIILDREMPESRSPRRFLAFWWALAGIAVIGLSGAFMYLNDTVTASPVHHNQMQVPAIEPAPSVPQKTEEQQKPAIHDDFASNNKGHHANTDSQSLSSYTKNQSSLSNKYVKSSKNQIISQQSFAEEVATAESKISVAPVENPTLTDEPTDAISKAEEYKYPIDDAAPMLNIGAVQPVEPLAIDYFTIPENEVGPVYANVMTKAADRRVKLKPTVEMSSLSGAHGGAAFYAGGGVDAIVSSKLSLNAGVGYRSFDPAVHLFSSNKDASPNLETNAILKTDMMYDASGAYVVSESLADVSYADLNPVVEYLHQFQAHGGMSWNFSKRFFLEAGVSFEFNTKAFSEYPIVVHDYTSTNAVPRVTHALNDYNVIRSSMNSLYAGIGYRIGKHLSFKVDWIHTDSPYLLTEQDAGQFVSFHQRDDFIRGINFGLKYSFL